MARRLSPLRMNGRQILDAILQVLPGDPSNATRGSYGYNSTMERLRIHNGTAFKSLAYTDDIQNGGDASSVNGATAAQLRDRGTHTGSQPASTISDFQAAVLGISGLATDAEVDARIASLINAAPAALDTLKELSDALGGDANFASTVNTALAARARKFAVTFGNGTLTNFTFTHNLNTRDFVTGMYDAGTFEEYELPDITHTDLNTVAVSGFTVAPATNSLRLVLIGL